MEEEGFESLVLPIKTNRERERERQKERELKIVNNSPKGVDETRGCGFESLVFTNLPPSVGDLAKTLHVGTLHFYLLGVTVATKVKLLKSLSLSVFPFNLLGYFLRLWLFFYSIFIHLLV